MIKESKLAASECIISKILIVDDRPENLLVLRSSLECLECELVEAMSGQEALSLMLKHDFDLVLLDVQMPGMNGFEVAELMRAKQKTRQIPIIFITAINTEQQSVFKGYEIGAVDYLFKPISPMLLRNKVQVFLKVQHQKKLLKNQANALEQKMRELEAEIAERRRAEEALQWHSERLNTLHHIDQAILNAQSLEHIVQATLERMRHVIPCQRISVVEFDLERQEALVFAVWTEQTTGIEVSTILPLSRFGSEAQLRQQKLLIVENMDELSTLSPSEQMLYEEGIRSYINIPLVAHGELIGCFNLGANTAGAFPHEHVEIIREVAASLAVAMQQARLHHQIQRYAEELEQRVAERTAELSAANLELVRAARLKDEFLSTMSHELRTPLNPILGYTDMLMSQLFGPLNDKQCKCLKDIHKSGNNLLEIINDILDITKIEAGELKVLPALISAQDVCQKSLTMIAQKVEKKQLTLSTDFDPRVDIIYADDLRLRQILTHLLNNAVKFTPSGGSIGLNVLGDEPHKRILFTVWDTGIGIAPEDIQQLFQPFIQVDSSLSRKYEGTGLGLAIVKRLTELHDGQISVESEVNKGSRFTVALPWKREEPEQTPADSAELPNLPENIHAMEASGN